MNDSKQFVVITSIFAPTRAVTAFAKKAGWRLIVTGDRKTPAEWECPGAQLFTAQAQEASSYRVARELPWNHYCRKMLGYLEAARLGAEVIADTDDDNLPHEDWGFPPSEGLYQQTASDWGFANIYRLYTSQHIWPRGFPLKRIQDPASIPKLHQPTQPVRVGIWQGLADGDPDVDAIYRLTNNAPCYFDQKPPVVLDRGTLCPFNSQNTAFVKPLFPLLYLPALVTFRFTDILRSLVAQTIMWRHDYRLGFTSATVTQERNPHDYLADFESEIPCYLHPERIVAVVGGAIRGGGQIADDLMLAYEALLKAGIVLDREMRVLEAWLKDISQ